MVFQSRKLSKRWTLLVQSSRLINYIWVTTHEISQIISISSTSQQRSCTLFIYPSILLTNCFQCIMQTIYGTIIVKKQKKISSENLLPKKISSNKMNFRTFLKGLIPSCSFGICMESDFVLFFMLRSNARMRFSLPLWRPFETTRKILWKNALQIHDFYNNNNSNWET